MGLQSASYFNFTPFLHIEISQEELKAAIAQVEAELLESEIYRRTMAGLEKLLGEAVETAQNLVQAVGKEAIRLSLRQVAKKYQGITTQFAPNPVFSAPIELELSNTCETPVSSLDPSLPLEPTDSDLLASAHSFLAQPIGLTLIPKLSKKEQQEQLTKEQREARLVEIGQVLKQARQNLGVSRAYLHQKTFIVEDLIKALEEGTIHKLPEDVFVRSFIQKLGNALNLDGKTLADSLPQSLPSVVPSWYHPELATDYHQVSIPIYLGYTALVAGAIGGLSWLSNQSQTPTLLKLVEPSSPNSISNLNHDLELELETDLNIDNNIAPPEVEAIPMISNKY